MMHYTYVILATVQNVFRMLQRVSSLMTRNRIKMQQITVIELDIDGLAHLSLALQTDQESIEKLLNQIRKMPDLLEVEISERIN